MSNVNGPNLQSIFELLLSNGGDLITVVDAEGRVAFQSPSIKDLLGYEPEDLVGEIVFDFIHPVDLAQAITSFHGSLRGDATERVVVRFESKDGNWEKMEVLGQAFEEDDQSWMVLTSRNVTAQHNTLERLKASEQLLNAAFNTSNSICAILEYDSWRIVDVNDAWVRSIGWSRESSIGSTLFELDAMGRTEDIAPFVKIISSGDKVREYPGSMKTKQGELVSLMVDAEKVAIEDRELVFLSALDVTERERSEARLRQSQRMEAIAQLTGGIAHDLNNMLTVVLGQIDLALHRPLELASFQDSLATIRKATERGSELIRQLMIFSRKQTLNPSVISINHCVLNLIPLLQGTIGGEVKIETRLGADSWKSFVDEALLENALLNLCLNARDAMPRGGELTLTTAEVTLPPKEAVAMNLPAGNYIRVAVSDTGEGMDEGSLNNAFEPYFTTKAVGQGTGLGLSMVFGFVTQTGGHVFLESEIGVGTTAIMYLPATTTESKPAAPEAQSNLDLSQKHVFVIEDNDELRTVVGQLLTSFGCKVTLSSGVEFSLPDESVDIILSDVVLPGRSQGPDLTQATLERYPNAKVVFMSGYPKDRFDDIDMLKNRPLLRKPFSRSELQEALGHSLELDGEP